VDGRHDIAKVMGDLCGDALLTAPDHGAGRCSVEYMISVSRAIAGGIANGVCLRLDIEAGATPNFGQTSPAR
jgi:hypothetical protein